MSLRVIWQYMDRSVTKQILYGPQLYLQFRKFYCEIEIKPKKKTQYKRKHLI